jgi:hypothetical protein
MIRTSPLPTRVPEHQVYTALSASGGNAIESGELASPESSAAVAANASGWLLERPADLPSFPPLVDLDRLARGVNVEPARSVTTALALGTLAPPSVNNARWVAASAVRFGACCYGEWGVVWPGDARHRATALAKRF